jgi:hypothetical protein
MVTKKRGNEASVCFVFSVVLLRFRIGSFRTSTRILRRLVAFMAVSHSKTVGNGKDGTLGIHVPFSPLRYFAMRAIRDHHVHHDKPNGFSDRDFGIS